MVPPKKNTIKMDLNSFLNDDSFGNVWAEDEVDLNKINISIKDVKPSNTIPLEDLAPGKSKMSHLDPALFTEKKERVEYPVPNEPPYKARINNLPWDIAEDGIKAWFEDGLQKPDSVLDLVAPRDINTSRLKGFAFVTFAERDDLENSLKFNGTKLNDRTVYVAVAAPQKDSMKFNGNNFDDFDWGSARGSNFQTSRQRRDEPDLNWGAARGSNFKESKEFMQREEPNLNWGTARGSHFKESKEKKSQEEVDLNWGTARGSNFREQKERTLKSESNLDWSTARGSNFREQKERKSRDEPVLDWSAARKSTLRDRKSKDEPPLNWASARNSDINKKTSNKPGNTKISPNESKQKIQKSVFEVLAIEDEDENEETQSFKKTEKTSISKLEKSTSELSIEKENEWKTVGKK